MELHWAWAEKRRRDKEEDLGSSNGRANSKRLKWMMKRFSVRDGKQPGQIARGRKR